MQSKRQSREALAGRVRRNRFMALLALAVVAVAVYFLISSAVRPSTRSECRRAACSRIATNLPWC